MPGWELVDSGPRAVLGITSLHKHMGSDLWGGPARLWEGLLDIFAQTCLSNERELQIRAAEVDVGVYQQPELLLVAQRLLSSKSSQQRGQHVVYWKTAISFAQN